MPCKEQLRTVSGIVEKYCPKCGEWKNRETEFSPKRGDNKKVRSWCKSCCVSSVAEWRKRKGRWQSDLTGRLQRLTSNLYRYNSTITTQDLREMYESQKGLCYYTGIEMKLMSDRKNDPFIMSLDRKDSNIGYVIENVVLCCYGMNALKGRHSEAEMYECLERFYKGAKKNGKFK